MSDQVIPNICPCNGKCECHIIWTGTVKGKKNKALHIPGGYKYIDSGRATTPGDLVWVPMTDDFRPPQDVKFKYMCVIRKTISRETQRLINASMVVSK